MISTGVIGNIETARLQLAGAVSMAHMGIHSGAKLTKSQAAKIAEAAVIRAELDAILARLRKI